MMLMLSLTLTTGGVGEVGAEGPEFLATPLTIAKMLTLTLTLHLIIAIMQNLTLDPTIGIT